MVTFVIVHDLLTAVFATPIDTVFVFVPESGHRLDKPVPPSKIEDLTLLTNKFCAFMFFWATAVRVSAYQTRSNNRH